MKRQILRVMAVLMLLAVTVPTAYAAPVEQQCMAGVVTQHDMAGTYASTTMTVKVYPCGGIWVQWQNNYGFHEAVYVTRDRVYGQGVIGHADERTPEKLDSSNVLGVKAAEPGFVQVYTVNMYDNLERVYRLRKVA